MSKDMKKNLKQDILRSLKKKREIISYLFWGIITTLISWGTYSLFVIFFSAEDKAVLIANILSWICAVIFAFVTNKLWVFKSKNWTLKIALSEFWKFIIARIVTGVIEVVGVPVLVAVGLDQNILGIEGMLAKILVSIAVIVLNYIFSKLLVFRENGKSVQ